MDELINVDQTIKRSLSEKSFDQMILFAKRRKLIPDNKIPIKHIASSLKPEEYVGLKAKDSAYRVNYKPLPWSDERLFCEVTKERNALIEKLTITS